MRNAQNSFTFFIFGILFVSIFRVSFIFDCMSKENPNNIKWFTLASVVFLGTSFCIYFMNAKENTLSKSEREKAQKMFVDTKMALDSISIYLNKGQESLQAIENYSEVREKVFKN